MLALAGFVSRAQKRQQEFEAEFRVSHTRLYLNSECINFYGGAQTEEALLNADLRPVARNLRYFGLMKLPLDFLANVLFSGSLVVASARRGDLGGAAVSD